jgi:hypothetical protein
LFPQALFEVPATQAWPEQHPDPHEPVQDPPQPLLAPPHFPEQFGVQTQAPPEQLYGLTQVAPFCHVVQSPERMQV